MRPGAKTTTLDDKRWNFPMKETRRNLTFFSERKRIVMRRQRKEGEEIGRDKQPGARTGLQKGLEKFVWKEQVGSCPAGAPTLCVPSITPARHLESRPQAPMPLSGGRGGGF